MKIYSKSEIKNYLALFDNVVLLTDVFLTKESLDFLRNINKHFPDLKESRKFVILFDAYNRLKSLLEHNDNSISNRIYFYRDNSKWDKNVNIYAFDNDGNPILTKYPGVAMTPAFQKWYYFDLPTPHCNVVFNDGKLKTVDLIFDKQQEYYYKDQWFTDFSKIPGFEDLSNVLIEANLLIQEFESSNFLRIYHPKASSKTHDFLKHFALVKQKKFLVLTQEIERASRILTDLLNLPKDASEGAYPTPVFAKILSKVSIQEFDLSSVESNQTTTTPAFKNANPVRVSPTPLHPLKPTTPLQPNPQPKQGSLNPIIFSKITVKNDVVGTSLNRIKQQNYAYFGGKNIPRDLAADVKYSHVAKPLKENDVIYMGRKKITVKTKLGSGGAAAIFELENTNYVLKLFNPKELVKLKEEKLDFMIQNPIKDSFLIWPIEKAFNIQGEFIGYVMPRVKFRYHISSFTDAMTRERFKATFPNLKRKEVVQLCINILEKFNILHQENILMADVNSKNVVFNSPNEVYFLDCDGYQIDRYAGWGIFPGYFPPEIPQEKMNNILKSVYREKDTEYFTIMILIWNVLFNHRPPYRQINTTAKDQFNDYYAKQGQFPFSAVSMKDTAKHVLDSQKAFKIWSHLPGYIKRAFWNLFSANGANFAVGKRIPITTLISLFKNYYKQLADGSLEKVDPEANEPIPENAIDYAVVDKFNPTSDVQAYAKGLVMHDLVHKTLSTIGYPINASISVTQIIKDLESRRFFKTKDLTAELILDLGIYKEIKFLYQKI